MTTPSYDWVENWGSRDQAQESLSGWAHPGMATTSDGRIVSCDSGSSEILIYTQDGDIIHSWLGNFTDAHGITVVKVTFLRHRKSESARHTNQCFVITCRRIRSTKEPLPNGT